MLVEAAVPAGILSAVDRDVWMLLIGIVAGGVISWLVTIKYGNRENSVRLFFRRTSLEPQRSVEGFVPTFHGEPIDKPHLFELSLVNMGPQDIGPDDFGGGGCYFEVGGAEFLAVIENPHEREFEVEAAIPGGGFKVILEPCLLPKGQRAQISLICAGVPLPTTRHVQLRNVRLDKTNAERWSSRKVFITSVGISCAAGVIVGVGQGGIPSGLIVAWLVMFVSMGSIGALFGRREPSREFGALWD